MCIFSCILLKLNNRQRQNAAWCLKPFCGPTVHGRSKKGTKHVVNSSFPAGRQEAPGCKGQNVAAPNPQCNTSSAWLQDPCAGPATPNRTPSWPVCKQTFLLCTRRWHAGISSFIWFRHSGAENWKATESWQDCCLWDFLHFDELNSFLSAVVKKPSWSNLPLEREPKKIYMMAFRGARGPAGLDGGMRGRSQQPGASGPM